MNWKFLCSLVLLGSILLAGCQSAENRPILSSLPAATGFSPTGSVPDTGRTPAVHADILATLTPSEEALVLLAKERLAVKYRLHPQDLQLFSILPMTWPDSSLGCPRPDVLYQPVVTPGYQMVFEAGGQIYVVHSDENNTIIICAERAPDEIYPTP